MPSSSSTMCHIIIISGAAMLFLIVIVVDCTGDYKVIGSHHPIKVLAGQDVVLPCHLEPPVDVTTLTAEWSFGSTLVHIYRNRKDDLTLQHNDYKGRTSLFREVMGNGNLSIQISKVNKEDEGNYTCFVPKLKSEFRRGYVSLIVEDKVNKPKPIVDSSKSPSVGVGLAILSVLLIIVI